MLQYNIFSLKHVNINSLFQAKYEMSESCTLLHCVTCICVIGTVCPFLSCFESLNFLFFAAMDGISGLWNIKKITKVKRNVNIIFMCHISA